MARRSSVHLTDAAIRKLQPREGPYRVTDASTSCLSVLVLPSGRRSFCARFTAGGRRRQVTLGSYPAIGLAEARVQARRLVSEAERDQLGLDTGTLPFDRLCALYLEEYSKPRKRSWQQDERQIEKELLPTFGSALVGDIQRGAIEEFVMGRWRSSPSTARQLHALLSGIFRFAVRRDLLERSPMADGAVPKPPAKPKPSSDRVLDADEIAALWRVWNKEGSLLSAAAMLWTITGARMNEILAMRWAEVALDEQAYLIPAERMKAGQAHRLPFGPAAAGIFQQLHLVRSGPWVFPSAVTDGPLGQPKAAIKRWSKAAGVENWGPRILRRSVATWLPALGVVPEVIDVVLAHVPATRDVTRRDYIRYRYQDETRSALTALEEWLAEIVGQSLVWTPHDGTMKSPGRSSFDPAERSEIARRAANKRWSRRA